MQIDSGVSFQYNKGEKMRSFALTSVFIVFTLSVFAQKIPTRDKNMALGNPSSATSLITDSNNYLLIKSQYALSYNNSKGMANWVSWHLSAAWKGTAVRCNCFTQDSTLPTGYFRASTSNYTGTGFDRGHLCPSDDRDGSDSDNRATFKMSNISPQAPVLNQQTWGNLEDYCRSLLNQGKELYIIAGGYGSGGSGSGGGTTFNIAGGSINVPAYFWKIIVVLPVDSNDVSRITTTTRVITVLMPNTQTVNSHSWDYYRVSVDSIEALTGYDFLSNVDTSIQKVIEATTDKGPATLAGWDFTGANNVSAWGATTINSILDTFGGKYIITRGTSASSSSGANSFRTTGFQNNGISTTNTDYYQVKLKAKTGYTLSLSSIDATYAGTGTFCASPGVSAQFAYSLDGTSYTLIDTLFTLTGTPSAMNTIDLSGIGTLQHLPSTQTIYLRYYASGQTTTGGWGFYSSDTGNNGLSVGGSIDPVGTISGASSVCPGATIPLTDSTPGGTWSSSNTAIAVIGSNTGIIAGIAAGSATISYTISGSLFTTAVTVNPLPNAGSVTGSPSLCAGNIITLTDLTSGGTWSSSNTAIVTIGSTGIVTGLSAGTSTISYTIINSCGSASATATLTVNPLPSTPAGITGIPTVCVSRTTMLSDGTAGGSWGSSNTSVAMAGSTGIITGVIAGNAIISYTLSNICGSASATATLTVNPLPSTPAGITGIPIVCVGGTTLLSDATAGGSWKSSNTAVATAGSTGIITGITAGTATISYTISNSCGNASATTTMTVNPLPSTPASITGIPTVCVGSTTLLSDATAGGSWKSSNTAVATVGSTGIITGVIAGAVIINYTVSNSCGSASATSTVTVNPLPSIPAGITGIPTVCVGSSTLLSDATAGGSWKSSNTTDATVGSTGIVTGITAGTATISYTVSNSCGSASATATVTVNPLPSIPAGITGILTFCVGNTTLLSDATAGGSWKSSNTAVATAGSTGIITGLTAGAATISYTVSNSCGSASATATVTVNPLPNAGTITGSSSVCAGSTVTFTDGISGGTWSATNTKAFVSSSGAVYGVMAGIDTIIYIITNSCGTATASKFITINPLPNPGTITGLSSVCMGSGIILSDTASGGAWNASNGNATVVSGLVSGVIAGIDTIIYTVSNLCGTAITSKIIIISPLPYSGSITGTSSVCPGTTITLTDTITGGIWSASNGRAFVSSGSVVYGISAGIDTIIYTVINSCGTATTSKAITINPLAYAGNINGLTNVCEGSIVTITDTITGGIWSSSRNTVAIIGSSSGIVMGITAGTAIISYTVSNVCDTASTTIVLTVNPLPYADTITGPGFVCPGSTIILTDSVSGGLWSLSDSTVAAISNTGIVTGITAGPVTTSYTVNNLCGSSSATHEITVMSVFDCNTLIRGIGASPDFIIYPNPASTELQIRAPVKVTVLLQSIDGKILIRQDNAKVIDISNIADGMYFIKIYDENNFLRKTARFIKAK